MVGKYTEFSCTHFLLHQTHCVCCPQAVFRCMVKISGYIDLPICRTVEDRSFVFLQAVAFIDFCITSEIIQIRVLNYLKILTFIIPQRWYHIRSKAGDPETQKDNTNLHSHFGGYILVWNVFVFFRFWRTFDNWKPSFVDFGNGELNRVRCVARRFFLDFYIILK